MQRETSIAEKAKSKKLRKAEQNIQKLWNYYERCNLNKIGIPKGEERKEQKKNLKQQ